MYIYVILTRSMYNLDDSIKNRAGNIITVIIISCMKNCAWKWYHDSSVNQTTFKPIFVTVAKWLSFYIPRDGKRGMIED